MEIKELRNKTTKELSDTLKTLKKDLIEANQKLINQKEKSFKDKRNTKKSIAKVMTVIKEKELLSKETNE